MTSKEIGKWCGGPMKPFVSSGRNMLVVMVTDENDNTGLHARANFFGLVREYLVNESSLIFYDTFNTLFR